jgi:hypothetical protein
MQKKRKNEHTLLNRNNNMNTHNGDNLENKFFYRLTKILYFLFLTTVIAILSCVLFYKLTYFPLDNSKSKIVCSNGKEYTFKGINILSEYLYTENLQLHDYSEDDDNQAARSACSNNPEDYKNWGNRDRLLSGGDLDKIYTLKAARDWHKVATAFRYSCLIFLAFYIVLNITRESLIYLAFGKKLTWNWLVKFKKLLPH